MNKMKTGFLALSAIFSLTIASAQTTDGNTLTADEIVAKHTDAVGGKDKLSQINSMYAESSTEVMGNQSATKTYVVNGKGYRNESDFGGQNFVQVITDTSGWMINPFAGAPDPTPISQEEFQAGADQVYVVDPLLNYAANGAKIELQGQEKVGDVNAYKLKFTNKYNSESTLYIDPSTWYIIQLVQKGQAMGQEVTVTVGYSNYQKTDFGVFMPYTRHIDMGQFALDITTNKVEVNKDIDPKLFEISK